MPRTTLVAAAAAALAIAGLLTGCGGDEDATTAGSAWSADPSDEADAGRSSETVENSPDDADLDPCTLVTAQQVQEAAGSGEVRDGVARSQGERRLCVFSVDGGPLDDRDPVTVGHSEETDGTAGFATLRAAGAFSEGVSDVPGVGDEAIFISSIGTLALRKGATTIQINAAATKDGPPGPLTEIAKHVAAALP